MLRLKNLLFALCLCFVITPAKALYPKASHLLDSLDYYIANQSSYHQQVCSEIRAKSKTIKKTALSCQQLSVYAEVVSDYVHVDADSALYYADLAIKLCKHCNDNANAARFYALRSLALTNRGDVYLATVAYENVNKFDIAPANKAEYFEVGFNVYTRAFIFLPNGKKKHSPYEAKLKSVLDSVNAHLTNDNTKIRYYNDISRIHSDGESIDGIADIIDLLTYSKVGTYLYGQMATEIARYYMKEGQNDLAKYYFTTAAISNIIGDINETDALHGLGMLLHAEGDTDHANKYLKEALDQALLDGDQAAAMQVAQSLKTLLDDINNKASKNKYIYILLITLALTLSVLIIIGAIYFYNKRKYFYMRNSHLRQKHANKNVYIRKLLALCSLELNTLEEYNRLVSRKLKGSQVTDLLRIAESGVVIEEQLQNFQTEFDNSFLATHPNFIENVNELMQEDKKYSPLPGGTLNTELRYLAFMSLGVDDYQQIAIFLGITQSSAYTYKNKLKSKAIDRENFEENILNLD